ncbi:MAG: discoidin domain-containing protein [Phycisphaerae bacterium]|nr:discoidin domain-containing protein [Phycisphaerae bacterium]
MSKTVIHALVLLVLLCLVTALQAADKPFSVKAFIDQHVCNDAQVGPDKNEQQIGVHVRDIDGRRRVGLFSFDISALKGEGIVFSSVSLSNLGASAGVCNVYGVIEDQDNLVPETELTWNKAPGVKNDPAPAINTAVTLDTADLTPLLLTFTSPANFVRASTATSQALADFINADTDGIITLLFAPNAGAGAILRAKENNEGPAGQPPMEGGTFLQGLYGVPTYLPSNPNPADRELDAFRDNGLSWAPGVFAQTHDVYLGTDPNAVRQATPADPMGVLVSAGQTGTTFDCGRLPFGQTYYWRVDEVNAPPTSTVYRGPLWSFTVEPQVYIVPGVVATASGPHEEGMGPENTVNGSGMDPNQGHSIEMTDMWLSSSGEAGPVSIQFDLGKARRLDAMQVWNHNSEFEAEVGFGVKDVTVEMSQDGTTWTALGDFVLNQAPGVVGTGADTAIGLGGAAARHVRLLVRSNWGGLLDQYGLAEVRFLEIPTYARLPGPADGQADADLSAILSWRPGREAASHKLYFSTDQQAVAEGSAPVQALTQNVYLPGALAVGQTYFWRVDEVNDTEVPSVWTGDLWSFSTDPFVTVDDFEAYDDQCNRVYYVWKGGAGNSANAACGVGEYAGNGTGSAVGNNAPPYAATTVFHNGAQSMPVTYNNAAGAVTSLAERAWTSPQDWTAGGADTLRLYVRGLAANVADQLTVTVEGFSGSAGTVNHASLTVVQATTWQEWLIPFSSLEAMGVKMNSVKRIAVGVGDPATPRAGTGTIYIDDIQVGHPVTAP